jgi:hypothetical protein
MGTRRVSLVTVTLVGVLLTGCASPGAETPNLGGSVSAAESSRPVPTPSDRSAEITISGQVIDGVEAGCRLLAYNGVDYLLLASRPEDRDAIHAGAQLTVKGRPRPGMMTTCQQGTPFSVTEVLPG